MKSGKFPTEAKEFNLDSQSDSSQWTHGWQVFVVVELAQKKPISNRVFLAVQDGATREEKWNCQTLTLKFGSDFRQFPTEEISWRASEKLWTDLKFDSTRVRDSMKFITQLGRGRKIDRVDTGDQILEFGVDEKVEWILWDPIPCPFDSWFTVTRQGRHNGSTFLVIEVWPTTLCSSFCSCLFYVLVTRNVMIKVFIGGITTNRSGEWEKDSVQWITELV